MKRSLTTYCRVNTHNHYQKGGFGTCDLVFPAYTHLYHSNEDLNDEQISMVAKGIVSNVSTIVIQGCRLVRHSATALNSTIFDVTTPKNHLRDFPREKYPVMYNKYTFHIPPTLLSSRYAFSVRSYLRK